MSESEPMSHDFWQSSTLDELARSQGIRPLYDMRLIIGTWPGDVDDGFEAAVDALRNAGSEEGNNASF